MATARFRPQAWIRDNAVEVDPEGPTTWVVSPAYLAEMVAFCGIEKLYEASYEADELRHDPAAPEWIREWRGPFDVSLEHIDEEQMAELKHSPECRPEDMTEPDEEGIRDCRRCGLWERAPELAESTKHKEGVRSMSGGMNPYLEDDERAEAWEKGANTALNTVEACGALGGEYLTNVITEASDALFGLPDDEEEL